MSNKFIAVILVLMLTLASGCGVKTEEVKPLTLDSLIESVNQKNEAFITRDASYDEAEYLKDYENIEFSDDEIKSLSSFDYDNVTKEEAKEDVDTMFRALKSLYAGYTYFGGDKAFNKAKEEIKSSIDAYEKDKINQQNFAQIISQHLGFIKDSHFRVGGNTCFDEANTYYESSKMQFLETGSGYFTEIDGKRYYLAEEYEKYLKITIAESGELVYGIFAVVTSSDKEKLPAKLELTAGSRTKEIDIEWVLSEVGGDQATLSEYSEEDSVAISSLSAMSVTEFDFSQTNDFLNNSKKHAEHEYSILDLRNNSGGTAEVDMMWVYGYTGEITDISYPQIVLATDFYNKIKSPFMDEQYIDLYSELDIVDEKIKAEFLNGEPLTGITTRDGTLDNKPEKMINNDNTLFVLQSKRNYSSGEVFIMMLDSVENTLSVGTNTNGCIHLGNVFGLSLPNSGLELMYSRSILVGFDKEFDVYGLEPDIYIADDDAQDAVLRCINYYSQK